jgi:predicted ester cyclase
MSEQENIQMAQQGVALLNAHDFDRYVQRIDESYVGESETVPGGVRGPAGVRQQLDLLLSAFPDLRVELEQVIGSGDQLVSRFRITGTHKGNFAGIAPTNRTVSWGVCSVTEIATQSNSGSTLRGQRRSSSRSAPWVQGDRAG